jgi:transketolase
MEHTDRPTALALTRQALPIIDRDVYAGADGVARGGYILADASDGQPKVILIGTGSEVDLCLTARERLEADGTPTRVVSMPCQEWFRAQEESYREKVIPRGIKARVSVEAGIAMSWRDLIGDCGEAVSLEHFGASAPYQVIFEQFGFTPDHVVAAAHASLAKVGEITGTTTGN